MTDIPRSKRFDTKVMCKDCQQETWHTILNKVEHHWSNEDGLWEDKTSYTLQCLGCDNVCLLIRYVFSEDIDTQTGEPELQESIHPSPYKNDREPIIRLFHVPKNAASVYEETIKA